MIFWVLLVLAVLVVVGTFVWFAFLDDLRMGIGFGLLTALLAAIGSAIVGGGLLALSLLIPGGKVTHETFPLRALATSSTVQGRFFLGSGYVNGERTLNYVAQDNGYARIDQGIGTASRIFEGSTKPTVTEYTYWYSNGWVLPWEFKTGYSWDFRVPSGSILEDYTITNQ